METLTYPNLRQGIWLAVLFILWTIVTSIIFHIIDTPSYINSTLTYGSMAIAFAIGFWKKSMDRSILHVQKLHMPILLLAMAGTLCIPWVHSIFYNIVPFPKFITETYAEIEKSGKYDDIPVILMIINAILLPFIMEILFRGIIQRGLMSEYPLWKSIALAAIIYAATWGCLTLLPLLGLIYGLWYGWLYAYSRNLWICIFSSLLSQFISIAYITSTEYLVLPSEVNDAMTGKSWVVNLIATLLFSIITYFLYKTFKRNEN